MEVALGPGHIVLDGNPAPLPQQGAEPLPQFSAHTVVAKWLDGSRCHLVGRPHPRRHCVKWVPNSPIPKAGGAPNFRPMSVVAKWLDG